MSCASESKAITVFAASAPSKVISGWNLRASADVCASCACLVVSAVQTALSSGSMRLECIAWSRRVCAVREELIVFLKCAPLRCALACGARKDFSLLLTHPSGFACARLQGGLGVTFQEVVHSSKTREADCDEQSTQPGAPEWTFIRMHDLPLSVESSWHNASFFRR